MAMRHTGPARRTVITLLSVGFLVITFVYLVFHQNSPAKLASRGRSDIRGTLTNTAPAKALLTGHAIAPKLGNETAKAELGRAAWKLFHTTFARFPDTPTADESEALRSYIHLFQRLYPCGECATHFGEILTRFPPQVSSRSGAAAWGCHVHNQVNKSLKKDLFDCSKIGDFYDCGCAEDEDAKENDR